MKDVDPRKEQALREELEQSSTKLDQLVRDLHAVDEELAALSGERPRYQLLDTACGALEQLAEMGCSTLFWGPDGASPQRLAAARGQVQAFQKRLEEAERRREEALDAISSQQESVEFLEDDLWELERQAERRKNQWVIEREVTSLPEGASIMPWARGGEDDARFRRSLAGSLLASVALGLLLPLIELPLPEPWEPDEVPERLARLIREARPLPPPPPARPRPADPEIPPEADPVAAPQDPEATKAAAGILAFRERFSGIAKSRPTDRLGARARISSSGEAAGRRPERSLVATRAADSSGGINLAALSRDVGGGSGDRIEGVQVTRATSAIAGAGSADRPRSEGPRLGRTDEEIQIVFDRHKAALYRLYNRELRQDPTLKGQMLLRIRIEPDGSVSLCELQASDMDAPALSAQVVERVSSFDFGAKDGIPAVTILYPIDFLPAT